MVWLCEDHVYELVQIIINLHPLFLQDSTGTRDVPTWSEISHKLGVLHRHIKHYKISAVRQQQTWTDVYSMQLSPA